MIQAIKSHRRTNVNQRPRRAAIPDRAISKIHGFAAVSR